MALGQSCSLTSESHIYKTLVTFTHWGRVTHICVIKLTTIGSDNDLPPGRRRAIIWTNAEMLEYC